MNDQLIGLAGLALAGVLGFVAVTGRVNLVGRIVVGLAALTTANQASKNFTLGL